MDMAGGKEAWASFTYYVSDKDGRNRSHDAKVVLVSPSAVIVSSDFRVSDDGWTTIGNRPNGVTHDYYSRDKLHQYIYASENSLNINTKGEDIDVWYFLLPSKFHGWNGILYGGRIEFTISSFGGDFAKTRGKESKQINMVEISCAKCNINKGITIGFPLDAVDKFDGTVKTYSLALNESSGWLKDPRNTNFKWTVPSQCDIIQVLSGISSIKILGDLTTWYEIVSIDDVQLVTAKPVGRRQLPSCAQLTSDASKCTCT